MQAEFEIMRFGRRGRGPLLAPRATRAMRARSGGTARSMPAPGVGILRTRPVSGAWRSQYPVIHLPDDGSAAANNGIDAIDAATVNASHAAYAPGAYAAADAAARAASRPASADADAAARPAFTIHGASPAAAGHRPECCCQRCCAFEFLEFQG